MIKTSHTRPLKIKSALVAGFFIAAQLSLGLSGGKVFAEEATNSISEQTSATLTEESPDVTLQNEENGATNSTAPESIQQGTENQQTESNVPAAQAIEEATEHANEHVVTALVNTPVVNTPSVQEQEAMVTLCHATGSATNPFIKITVAASGAFNGHLGNDHQNGEDIIPPFTFNGQTHSQNWNTAGQATFNNNCVAPTGGGGGEETKVTLCHATGSATNPFVVITVSAAGAFNGHLGASHQNGEDIIPPFTFNGQTYSQNWDAEGQATFNNKCVPPKNEEPEETKVTLCHATGSATNPFVKITVSAAGAFNGHLGASHQNGEDIIPPFTFNGQTYSQNWDAAGQATFNNGCVVPTGGQGGNEGGQVLGTTTTTTTGGQGAGELVNTGANMVPSILVSLAILSLTAGSYFISRKQYA